MSKYIDEMKSAVQSYKDTKQRADERIKLVRESYGEDAAKYEQDKIEQQIKAARTTAEAAIKEAYSEGVYLAEQWGKLDGARLTDDVKLLDAGLVDAEAFEKLKARHQDNATMLAALKKYGEQQNAAALKAAQDSGRPFVMEMPFNVRDIVTLDDKMHSWENAKSEALNMLDMIDGAGSFSDPWTRALGDSFGASMIEHFGEGVKY